MAASLWYQPSSHFCFWKKTKREKKMAGVTRLELATSCVTGDQMLKFGKFNASFYACKQSPNKGAVDTR